MADNSRPESTTRTTEADDSSSEAESTTYNVPLESPHSDESILATEEVAPPTFDGPPTDTATSRIDSLKAKAEQFISVRRSSSSSDQEHRPWRSTLIRLGPLSGIFGMLLALACLVASLGILAGSNNQLVTSWTTQPSTYIAIFTAIANLSMRYAAIQGVVLVWWTRALRGSNLSKLHWDWRSGTTLVGALTAGRYMGLLGLACIFSTLVAVDGPLLQKASQVKTAPVAADALSLNITMAQEIPRGYSGIWSTGKQSGFPGTPSMNTFNDTIPTPNGPAPNNVFSTVYQGIQSFTTASWYGNRPLDGVVHGCPDECNAKIRAPALFRTACETNVIPTNFRSVYDVMKVSEGVIAPPLSSLGFATQITLGFEGDSERVNLLTGFGTAENGCAGRGTFNYTFCTMAAGIGEYDVSIIDGKIQMVDLATPKLIALANNTRKFSDLKSDESYLSTLAGAVNMMDERWQCMLAYEKIPNNTLSWIFYGDTFKLYTHPTESWCASYTDPQKDMISSMNKLMVYLGAYFASQTGLKPGEVDEVGGIDAGRPIETTVTGYKSGKAPQFNTNYWYFFGAALIEVVCIAFIAPTYWGWWRIGRPVSFSPVEMAKAFESPLLSDCYSNSNGRALANAAPDKPLRYGIVAADPSGKTTKIAFADSNSVTPPRQGTLVDV